MNRFSESLAPSKKENQVVINNTRISVISSKIVRVERSNTCFIDNRTQAIYNRDYASCNAQIDVDGNIATINVDNRCYIINAKKLSFKVFIDNKQVFVSTRQNLKGTIRTLDGNIGFAKLPNGLMSKSGLTLLDDSKSCLLNEDGTISPRQSGYKDFYILAFGRDYLAGLKEFYSLSGKEPIIPKFALGNWWSRYHAYTDVEYLDLMDKFKQKDIPFTVSTVDMDWHIVKNVPKDVPCVFKFGRGWTGYTFEKEYFPDYKQFLKELHARNLKVALNLHPRDGVRYYEVQYNDMAKANGIEPSTKQPVKFDLTNPIFRDSYFDILHHPYENDGVDVWWIDWQQGKRSNIKGVDPLWLLNHYHYLDANRDKNSLILSRYSGIGSQRYPLGFSGDTFVNWHSLRLQPYFTITSANVGYTWWSHDIGGHMLNRGDNELYLRWLQLGCFLPINRLHSTNTTLSKEPWLYPNVEKDAIYFLKLRHSLIAYCYSASIVNHNDGVPICSPMYYFYDEDIAYDKRFRNQYIFNSNLLICPVTKSMGKKDASTLIVWFPNGKWVNIFNGNSYQGGKIMTITCQLSEYPVFIKQGGFLPLLKSSYNEIDYTNLLVKVYVGNGTYTLFDDDGSIKFSIESVNDGYKITAIKKDNILTKTIEYEFVGLNIDNITINLDKTNEIFVTNK